jgi:dTDP-4-dehydrorhamnose 3,5-epimerase-like enzyme
MSIENCKLIELPKISDPRGNLTFIEGNKHIPFSIKRVYYLYDVPTGSERGAHGHKSLEQVIVPLTGSFEIVLNDGFQEKNYYLKTPWVGLYVAPMLWRELKSFSSGSVCMVLASEYYDESDYFRSYADFISAVKRS